MFALQRILQQDLTGMVAVPILTGARIYTADTKGQDNMIANNQPATSKFRQVLESAPILDQDREAVELYANFLMNTWTGCIPSQAAERAVNEYAQNPQRIRNRKSGRAPEVQS